MGIYRVWAANAPQGGGPIPWDEARLLFDSRPGVVNQADQIMEPSLSRALNAVPKLTFTIPLGSAFASWVTPRLTWVRAEEQGATGPLFVGRAILVDGADTVGTPILCEGDLGVFNDTVCPDFNVGGVAMTPTQLVSQLVLAHNAQVDVSRQLGVGVVDDDIDPNGMIVRSSSARPLPTMWDILSRSTFSSSAGGYLWVSGQPGSRTLNWAKTQGGIVSQALTVDKSLLDVKNSADATGIVTAVEPFGAHLDESDQDSPRVTCGPDTPGATLLHIDPAGVEHWGFADAEAEAVYGRILISQTWDDVTTDVTLLARCGEIVAAAKGLKITINADAIDRHLVDPQAQAIEPGWTVPLRTPDALGLSTSLLCSAREERLDTVSMRLTLGAETTSLTSMVVDSMRAADQVTELVTSNAQLGAVVSDQARNLAESMANLSSQIDQTSAQIMTEVAAGYVTTDALGQQVQQLVSQISQTADQITVAFSQAQASTQQFNSDLISLQQQMQTLIRLTAAGVEVGRSESPMKALLADDGLHITMDGVEVAFFKADQSLIDKARVLTSLQVGGFIWLPLTAGRLDFRWMRGEV